MVKSNPLQSPCPFLSAFCKKACSMYMPHNNSQQQVATCIILFRPYVPERECSQRDHVLPRNASQQPSPLAQRECKSVFSKTNRARSRHSKGRKRKKRGGCWIRGEVRRGLLCSCSFFTLATKISFSLAHMQLFERSHVLFGLLYLVRAKTLIVNSARLCRFTAAFQLKAFSN